MGSMPDTRRLPGQELATRPLHLIWLIDCSTSMGEDGKIDVLNNFIRESIPHLRAAAGDNPFVDILVRVITFSTGARWHVGTPRPIEKFEWVDLTAGGARDLGLALSMVAECLETPPLPARALPPVLVLVTDGAPTDDYDAGLKALLDRPWGRQAVRLVVPLGSKADPEVIREFIGTSDFQPIQANDFESIARYFRYVSTEVSLISRRKETPDHASGLSDLPREKLRQIISQYGAPVYQDAQRCEAFLRDFCGVYKREINVLIAALKHGITEEFSLHATSLPDEILLSRLTKQLEDEVGLTGIAARWAVESWAVVLGVTSITDVKRARESALTIRQSAALSDSVTYFVRQSADRRESVNLIVRGWTDNEPPEPLWHRREAEKIRRYVVSTKGKPILLTGYGHFGATYLTQWAIRESAKELAKQTGTREETVVVTIPSDLVGRDPKGLWLRINKWVIDVWENPVHERFRKRYREKLHSLGKYPFFNLQELTTTEKGAVLRTGLQVGGAVGKGEVTGEGKQREVKEVYIPLDHQTQLERLLQALAVSLPVEPASGIMRLLHGLRNDGIPHRIVLLLDKIDDWVQLKGLETLFEAGGALKIIAVVDKTHYDKWKASDKSGVWIERCFNVIKCPPVLNDELSEALSRFYFELSEADLSKPLVRDFIDGLNFYCYGAPGNITRALAEHWESSLTVDGAGRITLPLSDGVGLMPQYRVWAHAGRLLSENWKEIIGNYDPLEPPDHPSIGEYQDRVRLFLYEVLKKVIKLGNTGFSDLRLFALCQNAEAALNLELSRERLTEVCRKLIESMGREGIV